LASFFEASLTGTSSAITALATLEIITNATKTVLFIDNSPLNLRFLLLDGINVIKGIGDQQALPIPLIASNDLLG